MKHAVHSLFLHEQMQATPQKLQLQKRLPDNHQKTYGLRT